MRKIVFVILLLLIGLTSFAQQNILHLKFIDGENVEISLNQFPKLSFSNNNLCIEWKENIFYYPYDNITDFSYSVASEESGIKDVTNNSFNHLSLCDDGLLVTNKSLVEVYSIDGNLVLKKTDFIGLLPYSDLPYGLLILKVNNVSFKYMNHKK